MYKSNPIQMIRDGKQITLSKFIACYQYKTDGLHDKNEVDNKSLSVKIYGISKEGIELLSTCYMETGYDYNSMEYASSVNHGIDTRECSHVYFEYDRKESNDFFRFIGRPQIVVDVTEMTDIIDNSVSVESI